MGRAPCCEKVGLRRGRWSDEEDKILSDYIQANGEGSWRSLPKKAGLLRCGKSCRLRWINYLRCDVKRGNISKDEEDSIIKLHASIGSKWSLIAAHLGGGRTDNEIKNYWNSHLNPLRTKISHITRRRSSMKNKKKPLQDSHSKTSSLPNNSSHEEKEKEKDKDCSVEDEGGLLMMVDGSDQMVLHNALTGNEQVDDVWEWDFEGLELEGVEEENKSMLWSWPWDDDQAAVPLVAHDQNNKNQADAIIAWLLS